MTTDVSKSPRCHLPWQQMVISAYGLAMPCCSWSAYDNDNPPIGDVSTQSLLDVWNGEPYQRLRAAMAAGDLEAAGCAKCQALRQGLNYTLTYDEDADTESPPTSAYAKNIALLKQEVAAGATRLNARPTMLMVTPSHRCNLRCVHCYQGASREAKLSRAGVMDGGTRSAPLPGTAHRWRR